MVAEIQQIDHQMRQERSKFYDGRNALKRWLHEQRNELNDDQKKFKLALEKALSAL